MRCSDWSKSLSPDQLQYAALDAWASLLCCQRLLQIVDPNTESAPPNSALVLGQKVLLYTSTLTALVAEAEVVQLPDSTSSRMSGQWPEVRVKAICVRTPAAIVVGDSEHRSIETLLDGRPVGPLIFHALIESNTHALNGSNTDALIESHTDVLIESNTDALIDQMQMY